MLTWMCNRCLRRLAGCSEEDKRTLYEQRLGVLRGVMQACRSRDLVARYAASLMTRSASNIWIDADLHLHQVTVIQIHNLMDKAGRAFSIGSQVADTINASSTNDCPPESAHVNAVANYINMRSNGNKENAEAENQTNSDEIMEKESADCDIWAVMRTQ